MSLARLGRRLSGSPLARLRAGAWRERSVPEACVGVATMLMPDELRLLDFLAGDYFEGRGLIVDAGCFLGGSTLALASGLRRRGLGDKVLHVYDLFEVEDWTRGVYFPASVAANDSTRPLFNRNVAGFADLIDVHEGDIMRATGPAGPVEILFIDVAKHWTVCDRLTEIFFPSLIPGRSIVVQQDYLYHHWVGWLHITMEHFADHFERLCDTGRNSVAFLHTKPFQPGDLRPGLVATMPRARHVELMERAAARFPKAQADTMRAAAAHFLELFHGG